MATTAEVRRDAGNAPVSVKAAYEKLKPGPGMAPSEVASHQRRRIIRALIDLVAERGYAKASVRGLTRQAGISTRTFYERFEDKEDCFLQAYDGIVSSAARRFVVAQSEGGDGYERLRSLLRAFARELEQNPQAARLALIEINALGAKGIKRARQAEAMLEVLIADCLGGANGHQPPAFLPKAISAGAIGTARARLMGYQEDDLDQLGDRLTDWSLSLFATELDPESLFKRTPSISNDDDSVPMSGPPIESSRQPDDEQDLILTAATRLANGPESGEFTINDVCQASGLPRRAFRAHFDGVDDCLASVVERRLQRTFAETQNFQANYLCTQITSDPLLVRLCLEESPTTDLTRVRCRAAFVNAMAWLMKEMTSVSAETADIAVEASAASILAILRQRIADHGPLPTLVSQIALILSLLSTGDSRVIENKKRGKLDWKPPECEAPLAWEARVMPPSR